MVIKRTLIFIVAFILIALSSSLAEAYRITLAWDPVTTNVDGTPIEDLAGYRLYYGTSSGNYTHVIDVGNVTEYTVYNLKSGVYYFAVTAYDVAGNESDFSNEISVLLDDLPFAGDWNGDGYDEIGVYRAGNLYLDNGNGIWDGCGVEVCGGLFGGLLEDRPVAGNWNGDVYDEIGIFNKGYWYLDDGNRVWDGCGVDVCGGPFGGLPQDIAVAGDWNGDGYDEIGVFRDGRWYLDNGNTRWDGCSLDTCWGPFGM